MRDWSNKQWLRRANEFKRDGDRIVFWTLVVAYVIAKAHNWV